MTAREDLCACPRCGSGEWSYCDYGGCSKCRPREERETEDNDAAATVTARKDLCASPRADDRAILDSLADGPLSTREVSDRILARIRDEWAEKHGYDIEWGTEREPLGARLLASGEARDAGLKLLAHEIAPRLVSLERRGAVERVQIAGKRPMLWSRRV